MNKITKAATAAAFTILLVGCGEGDTTVDTGGGDFNEIDCSIRISEAGGGEGSTSTIQAEACTTTTTTTTTGIDPDSIDGVTLRDPCEGLSDSTCAELTE